MNLCVMEEPDAIADSYVYIYSYIDIITFLTLNNRLSK